MDGGTPGPDSTPPGDGAAPGTRVELGTGIANFEPIAESGATIELVHGSQGGCHIHVTARVWADSVDGALIVFTATGEGIDQAGMTGSSESSYRLSGPVVREGDHWVRSGDFVVLRNPCEPHGASIPVVGQTLDVTVRVDLTTGESPMNSRQVTVVDDDE